MKRFPLIIVGILTGSTTAIALGSSVLAIEQYGTTEPISYAQAAAVHYLAWPQSRAAIVSRLGYPNAFDRDADYYDLPDGSYIAIRYDGTTATGLRRGF